MRINSPYRPRNCVKTILLTLFCRCHSILVVIQYKVTVQVGGSMRKALAVLVVISVQTLTVSGHAEPDKARGQQLFGRACVACHSLKPGVNMTGPSLSALWGRKAGTLETFNRYSPALKSADVRWGDEALNAWITDPKAFIPNNHMLFPGLPDQAAREDLIAFLKDATQAGEAAPHTEGMMGMGATAPKLKAVSPSSQVTQIRYCADTYNVTTADGQTAQIWERNLRFKTDSSTDGPLKGFPAIVGAGMVGDRSSIIFSAPEEIGQFIRRQC